MIRNKEILSEKKKKQIETVKRLREKKIDRTQNKRET